MSEARKSIPASRDTLQSRLLVWTVGPALIFFCYQSVALALAGPPQPLTRLLTVAGLCLALSLLVVALRAGTVPAATFGGIICLLVSLENASPRDSILHTGFTPLLATLILTLGATRLRRSRQPGSLAQEERKPRTVAQVIANLGLAALAWPLLLNAPGWLSFPRSTLYLAAIPAALLAALCEATADTVSSEIGQAFGGQPRLLTTLRCVSPGTDGAVTFLGTLAGFVAAGIVASVGAAWGLPLTRTQAGLALAGGVSGLLFDSLLGATVEQRGWLGNDLVNFLSTGFAAALTLLLLYLLSG